MVTSNDRPSSYTFLSRRFLALLVPLLDLRPPSKIAFGTIAWTPQFPCTHGQKKEESSSAMQRLLSKFNHSDNCTYVYQLSHCKINTLSVSIYSLLRTHVDCIMNHSTSISSQPSKQAYLNCVLVSFIVVRITLWSRNLVHDTVVMFIKY